MRRIRLLAAAFMLLACVNVSRAQGVISFNCGYPLAPCSPGVIEVAGSFTPDCGWTLSGCTGTLTVWQDGMVATCANVTISGNNFSGVMTGLQSGVPYYVFFEVTLVDPCMNTATIRTAAPSVTTN